MKKIAKLFIFVILGMLIVVTMYKSGQSKIYVCVTVDLESDVDFDKDYFEEIEETSYELFNIFDKNKLKGKITWLVMADKDRNIFQCYPMLIREIKDRGDELGLHLHGISKMDQEEIRYLVENAVKFASKYSLNLSSFRAGSFRYNSIATKILEEYGFKVDLSGYPNNHGEVWTGMPRTPYYLDYESPNKEGKSDILEIPIGVDLEGSKFTSNLYASLDLSKKIFDGYLKNSKERDVFFVVYFHNWNAMRIDYSGNLYGIDKNWLNKLDCFLRYIKSKGAIFVTTYQAREIWIDSKSKYVDYGKPSIFKIYFESLKIAINEGGWVVYKLKRTGKFKTYGGIFCILLWLFFFLTYLGLRRKF